MWAEIVAAFHCMNMAVCSEDAGAAGAIREASEIGNLAARFADDQHTRRGVPRVQTEFPEAVEAPAGDGAEIERGGAIAADAVRPQSEFPVVVDVRVVCRV